MRAKNAQKLAEFLAAHDRCVISGALNCTVVFYVFCEPNLLVFISDPASVHASVLNESFCAKDYESAKLARAAQIKERAPISVAINDATRWSALCAQARVQPTSALARQQFFARYPAARLALGHEIYTLQICWAKYKDLKGLARWEYELADY